MKIEQTWVEYHSTYWREMVQKDWHTVMVNRDGWALMLREVGPSHLVRERLRCAVCGHRGAVLQHPSWMDTQIGEQPFPFEWAGIAARSRAEDLH